MSTEATWNSVYEIGQEEERRMAEGKISPEILVRFPNWMIKIAVMAT